MSAPNLRCSSARPRPLGPPLSKAAEKPPQEAKSHLEWVTEGINVVRPMAVRLLGREKLELLGGEGAPLEPVLVTMLPTPIQKAMASPASRPTMAPCRDTTPCLSPYGKPT